MQVDVEMYLAASPPLFSPLMGPLDVVNGRSSSSSLSRRPFSTSSSYHQRQFNALDFDFAGMTLSPALLRSAAETTGLLGRRSQRPSPPTCAQQQRQASGLMAPLRSCLVIRPEEDHHQSLSEPSSPLSEDVPPPVSPSKKKKAVVFADAKGLSLTQVKMMTEPSDCPPRWTAEFLEQVTGGASADVAADRWELTFAQPACDYLDFRSRLDTQSVSLENAVVDEADGHLVGTIKVKNLSFAKTVTVRITFDNWASQTDCDAVFSSPGSIQGAGQQTAINLFDTFSFRIAIPAVVPANRIQFCIRFKCDAGEFWDSNLGKNYVIVRPILAKKAAMETANNKPSTRGTLRSHGSGIKYHDLLSPGSKVDLWADFASWNHLVNDSPYW